MAATASLVPSLATHSPTKMRYVKGLAEYPGLTSIPSAYTYTTTATDHATSDPEECSIPIIDFSLLVSGTPHQRSKIIHDLGKACQDWGFFMVINHGLQESMMKAMLEVCKSFFDLTEEEKQEFEGKHVLDPIRCGTSFNTSVEQVFFWRDFLKVFIHPEFHSPNKPAEFSKISLEYCKKTREVASELLEGISESLGLEACYINKAMNLETGFQILAANLYPPCPQPDHAMGMPPHSDHGLLTVLSQNGIDGLQIQHKGKWIKVNAIPNSFLVNTGDHLEILSNGKYKSVLHRAVVNNNATRISLAIGHGPSLDTIVSPAPELVNIKNHPPAYLGMKYREYVELQQSGQLDGKSCLDRVRVVNTE
ncbi:2OG-FeII_Oxy domain-containing protein/DIOX_N domain-containing protein [Cephalotus follicularis]|uniref:2OG-FeII_Oxy domain-containing protein/DIOX_N domain-containing protein n=1 Tax=Cephalotus follicularis TaxID=3775 RepID=A0A1Q3CHJ1_CEPFO|nr:2OG-FeII_Oxy domain-containing protein/DIOX_N domain-containing protein [Cephalotus follicularis]